VARRREIVGEDHSTSANCTVELIESGTRPPTGKETLHRAGERLARSRDLEEQTRLKEESPFDLR
jgi:hypothetical protein